jgi:hypothetical protein
VRRGWWFRQGPVHQRSRDRDHCATRTTVAIRLTDVKAPHNAERVAITVGRTTRIAAGGHGPNPL